MLIANEISFSEVTHLKVNRFDCSFLIHVKVADGNKNKTNKILIKSSFY